MIFKLKIETDNAAFDEDRAKRYEVSRILRNVTKCVEYGHTEGTLRDINGNRVGAWMFVDEDTS